MSNNPLFPKPNQQVPSAPPPKQEAFALSYEARKQNVFMFLNPLDKEEEGKEGFQSQLAAFNIDDAQIVSPAFIRELHGPNNSHVSLFKIQYQNE